MKEKTQNFKIDAQGDEMTGYYYNMLMSSMHVSVSKHLMDEYFTVIWANDYFYERTLYTREEYEAKYHNRCKDYFKQAPEELAKFEAAIQRALVNGDSGYESICKMPQKGGSYIWIKITGTFSEEYVNGIPVIYSVFTDVTEVIEQKELQKELEERTKQLRKAVDMAEAANHEKTNFLSRMSHDIRTPMNAIIGMTDIAYAHLDNPEKIKDCLKKISLSSQHLLGLINDVLDMSKIESGKMTISNDIISLPEIMENVVAIMQPSIKARKQHFDVRLIHVKDEQFYCDALRLRQVFINILSNASKFTPENGHIFFEVEEYPSDQSGTVWMKFTFCDTGMGIQSEFIEQIFNPFTRERDSRVDKIEGSGLGMAISKKIIDLMGGNIEVNSELGAGTTFIVYLPLKVCDSQLNIHQFSDLKLLLVDDDSTMCEYTTHMLQDVGVEADWVDNGIGAVEKVIKAHENRRDYDAVILDWQMPEQDGIWTTRMIRKQVGKELPILLVSSYNWADIEEDAIAAGVNGFITKPLFRSTLCLALEKFVLHQDNINEARPHFADFSGKNFLLVEDNEMNREIAIEMLTSVGATMAYACDGAQGIEKFKQSTEGFYDLILMDVQMPKMNGYEATREIRKMERKDANTVPILAMTADAFAEDISEAKNSGMNGHLAKPLNLSTLIREINRYI